MKTIQNIVVSNTQPTNKNVLWVDTSKNTKQLKIFYNNVWTNALNTLNPKELTSILEQSKQYTDEQIKELIGSAPEALNTLKELANAIEENEDVIDTLNKSVTNKQDKLVSGTNIKTINGESILGNGDIVIEGGGGGTSSGGAQALVEHGTNDTTFTLTPNVFHVWDEVNMLDLTLSEEQQGIVNEYLFQFKTSVDGATLILPDTISWANNLIPSIKGYKIYQVSILKGLAAIIEFNRPKIISQFEVEIWEGVFGQDKRTETYQYEVGMSWEQWVASEYNTNNIYSLDEYGYVHNTEIEFVASGDPSVKDQDGNYVQSWDLIKNITYNID